MAVLTTGLIKNTKASGSRLSSTFSVRMTNNDSVNVSIQIRGLYLNGTARIEYVFDVITLVPGSITRNTHYAKFDVFEFRFITSSDAVEILTWGIDATGDLTAVYPMVSAELFSFGMEGVKRAGGMAPSSLKSIYVANSSSNSISVIDGSTLSLQGVVKVGLGPFGVGINPTTNRIFIANSGSNNVSVIDGSNNTVITTVAVGIIPKGVGVDLITNRIYITNQGSNNVSVIDGISNIVISTIKVGASPEGVNINSITNRIYITNQESNNVSVINGSTNTVIATVELGNKI